MRKFGNTMKCVALILFLLELIPGQGTRNIRLTFLILTQENDYNSRCANELKINIREQASILGEDSPAIYLSHKDFSHVGDWTIIPILKGINEVIKNSSWLIIVEERTIIQLAYLAEILKEYDHSKELWVGHALEDKYPTIIHHFHDVKFKYPHMGAGIAITIPLLQRLANRTSAASKFTDFNIDKSFEFALFIWNEGNGTSIIHNNAFCTTKNSLCASYPEEFEACQKPVPQESIYFAVKTCLKFHANRVPVVLSTWGKYAKKLGFFSDAEDSSIPTISLGIPNTESGHCGKTIAMIKYLKKKIENTNTVKWIVVTDDDTILSVKRIEDLLSCYDSDDDVAIGERYGYGVYSSKGFNYITGGGGMIFSKTLLEKIANTCSCPSLSAPDDMIIGHCLADLGVKITHSHLFHQARPIDYSEHLLESDKHVSFHKHWMLDPIKVYQDWFAQEDLTLVESSRVKTEL